MNNYVQKIVLLITVASLGACAYVPQGIPGREHTLPTSLKITYDDQGFAKVTTNYTEGLRFGKTWHEELRGVKIFRYTPRAHYLNIGLKGLVDRDGLWERDNTCGAPRQTQRGSQKGFTVDLVDCYDPRSAFTPTQIFAYDREGALVHFAVLIEKGDAEYERFRNAPGYRLDTK